VVQEAFVRWHGAGRRHVGSPAAWLAKVVTNLSLTVLSSARVRRERYVGAWLPEPVFTGDGLLDPPQSAERRESVSPETGRAECTASGMHSARQDRGGRPFPAGPLPRETGQMSGARMRTGSPPRADTGCLWGARTRPLVLTCASTRLARIR
jgi:hypothetical protein